MYSVYRNYGYANEELVHGPAPYAEAEQVYAMELDAIIEDGEPEGFECLDLAFFTKEGEYDTRQSHRKGCF